MLILCFARGIMLIFLGIEVMSIPVYMLTALHYKSGRSIEAGLKYLVLGAISTAFIILGFALVYGASGSPILVDAVKAMAATNQLPMVLLALGFVLVGLLFKVGAVPLHGWVPDVYTGAPITITGFMSVAVKAASFMVALRIVLELFPMQNTFWVPVLWVAAALSMILGNFAALKQSNLKRMLAYSGIAHTGYLLVGLVALVNHGVNPEWDVLVKSGVAFYLLVYTLGNLGAFGMLVFFKHDPEEMEEIEDFRGLASKRPWVAIALAVFMISLAGLPPLGGFVGKLMVFSTAVNAGFIGLVVIAVFTSLVSIYYYLRPVVVMFLQSAEEKANWVDKWYPDWGVLLATILMVGFIILLGVYPGLVMAAL
jgi:NADH-quinone oxidoreductase subunit N